MLVDRSAIVPIVAFPEWSKFAELLAGVAKVIVV
jgi:hypothetical protein